MGSVTHEVAIRRTSDGVVRIDRIDVNEDQADSHYWWSEGNASCDCNRGDFFDNLDGIESDHECSEGRYTLDYVKRMDTGEIIYSEPPLQGSITSDNRPSP